MFRISDAAADESAGQIQFVLRRTRTTQVAKVRVQTVPGTALASADYTPLDQVITFAAGEASKVVTVLLTNDIYKETSENFSLRVRGVSNAVNGDDGSATGVITDLSDTATRPPSAPASPPSLSVDDVTIAEGAPNAPVVVRKHGVLNGLPSTFTLYTINGTAVAPGDYAQQQINVTFAADETSRTINIPLTDDSAPEQPEFFNVQLVPGANSKLYDGTAVVTITDSDTAPVDPPPPQTQTCPDGTVIPATSTCPETPPPTIPQQVDIPTDTLAGLNGMLVSHDYTTDLQVSGGGTGAIPGQMPAADPVGAYRQICGDGFLRKMDPILYPGQEVAGHLHDFSGDRGVNPNSTVTTLLNTSDSTCNHNPTTNQAAQNSVYWITALLDGKGNVVRPDYNSVYYKRRPANNVDCGDPSSAPNKIGICIPFPNGLRIISGSLLTPGQFAPANYRTDAGRYVYVNCHGTGAVSGRYANLQEAYNASPICPNLTVVIEFPDCWNGQYLWKVDRSHLVYGQYDNNGRFKCPATHPYKITTVTIHYEYTIDANWPTYKFASDDMDPTQPRGWSLHADAWLVWDERVKQLFHVGNGTVAGCIEGHRDCSGGDLGMGLQLKGAAQPTYGFTNPNRLTPISSLPAADRPDMTGH